MKKKKKARRIGEMTNSRGTWNIRPVTQVKQSGKIYKRKKLSTQDYE